MLITQSAGKFLKRKRTINVGGDLLDLTDPCIMGVINVTPDSFYDGNRVTSEIEMLEKVEQMVTDGVLIIDVGSVSTRPGAEMISTKDELSRLLPAVKAIKKHFPEIVLSVDTYKSWVAVSVMEEVGPVIVNDISGGSVVHDVSAELSESVRRLIKLGVADILIDPGFGFGKSMDHNYKLLNRLDSFKVFQLPVVVGLSRKSMVWKVLDTTPENALNGTTVLNIMALLGGADILRVHDVKPAAEVIRLFLQLKESI